MERIIHVLLQFKFLSNSVLSNNIFPRATLIVLLLTFRIYYTRFCTREFCSLLEIDDQLIIIQYF